MFTPFFMHIKIAIIINNNMDIKSKIFQLVDELLNKYFKENINTDFVKNQLEKDIEFANSLNKNDDLNGLYAIVFYRLTHEWLKITKIQNLTDIIFKIKNESRLFTTSYLSPFSIVGCPISVGENVFLDKNYKVGNNIVIGNNTLIIDNKLSDIDKKYIQIENDVKINNNIKIYSSNIGEGSKIKDNCIIREDIAKDSIVEVVSELQIKKNRVQSYIPSQVLSVYGVVPKYKNTFVLYGEGIYNPKVKLVVQNHYPNTEIVYWDKSKIIVRIKYFEVGKNEKSKLIVFSNGQRIVLNNSVGLQNTLKNLQN